MQFFHILLLSILSIVFISSVNAVPSDAEIEAMMGLQENVESYLASSNMSPEAKRKIQEQMAKKQAAIEKSYGRK
ncbi:uncharacterized protein CELE_Y116A8C.44 [Caenorhabditis elegans]|uniref:Uncharacterized protein n=1 Tax=Caenorhabditis elegans TaxID=6239 RepID=Q7YWS0_CAEEL|nr:Uncharacterized protein CELE_Y116A8C.44 [Caenorhabditis elegans]CAE17981.1 Uncharacterized protein CELE_Y116A8C.44 [Caenorhabditis elegans]|eukprot:NP_001023433.1 Uncharacterized protein CELE_Y116A8C.44 [Caenorhabditis elegans]